MEDVLKRDTAAARRWYKTAVIGIRIMLRNTMERTRRLVISI
jgi:hypothetical protein